jgi:hypothetical protein
VETGTTDARSRRTREEYTKKWNGFREGCVEQALCAATRRDMALRNRSTLWKLDRPVPESSPPLSGSSRRSGFGITGLSGAAEQSESPRPDRRSCAARLRGWPVCHLSGAALDEVANARLHGSATRSAALVRTHERSRVGRAFWQ